MNLPNIISFSRIPLLFIIVGLLSSNWLGTATIAFILFVLGGVSDWLDGHLARKMNNISNFGKVLDALTDKIFVVGVMVALLTLGILPNWSVFLVLVIIVREFLITGLRLIAASHGQILQAEKGGKRKTLTQLISIGTLICNYAFKIDFGTIINTTFMEVVQISGLTLFTVATFFTIQSGIHYMKKYWTLMGKGECI